MCNFLNVIASKDPNNVAELSKLYPGSLHSMLGLKGDDFIQYVVCYKCNSVYDLAACTEKLPAGQIIIKQCIHVEFPNHPMHNKRQPCGTPLLQKISRARVGNIKLQPLRYTHTIQSKLLCLVCLTTLVFYQCVIIGKSVRQIWNIWVIFMMATCGKITNLFWLFHIL